MIISPWQKPFRGLQLNKAHPLARGLVGCWVMNEGSGGKIYDLVNHHEGDFNANAGAYPTWSPGGVQFDSNGESIKGPNGSFLKSKGTIAFGYKQTVVPATFYYWFVLDDDFNEFCLNVEVVPQSIYFRINSAECHLVGACSWVDGEYHDVVAVWDANADQRRIYDNTNLIGTCSNAFAWDTAGVAAHNLHIGGRLTGADRYAGGIIYYFYAFDRVLPPSQIAWLHREPYAMFEPYIDPALLYVTCAQEYPYTASGEVTTAGSALLSKTRVYFSSGDIGISGNAVVVKGKAYIASGSVTLSGAAVCSTSAVNEYEASGEVLLTGIGLVCKGTAFVSSGEAIIGGAALTSYVGAGGEFIYIAVGGVDTYGLALLAKTRVYYPTGRTAL